MKIDDMLMYIISLEGGYVNNPADAGGPTNMGITLRTLSAYLGRQATIEELKNLSIDTAKEIYDRNYVVGPRFDTLPEDVQPIIVDAGILYGTRRAVIFVQNVINEANFGPIDVDGILGPTTRAKVTEAYSKMGPYFINAIVEERIMFCDQIVANNPSQQIFYKGWVNRANSYRVAVDGQQ